MLFPLYISITITIVYYKKKRVSNEFKHSFLLDFILFYFPELPNLPVPLSEAIA